MPHVADMLPEYSLGTLAAAENATVEAHLAGCSSCTAELAAANDTWSALALALPAVRPSADLRARVLQSIAGGASEGRFAAFVDKIAKLMDATRDTVRSLLDSIDDAAAWEAGPSATSRLMHLPAGPACADCLVGFVKVEAGHEFPFHKHLGDELVLVMQGALRDSDGSVACRGDVVVREGGTAHSFTAIGDQPLVYLVVLQQGVEFPGLPGFQV
jgi:predicted ChrR family anti-sigma factor